MFIAAAFVAFCIACSVLAFRRHPIYGLYFYFATTYIFPPGRWWGYLFGDFRWAFASAAVMALAIILHRGKLAPKPLWIGNTPAAVLTLYAIWMWLLFPLALDTADHMKGTTEFTKCLFSFWLVYRVVDSKEKVRDLMLAHVLGCTVLGVLAQFTGRQGDRLDGVGGPNLDDANTLGMYLITAAILALGLIMTQKGWRRWLSLGCLVIIINGFVLANSRGAFLGLAAGSLAFAFCMARKYRLLFWSFAMVAAIGATHIVDKAFIERMFTIGDVAREDEDADQSARSRAVIATAQIQMFLDHPIGTGHRGTAALSPRYLDRKWLTGDEDSASRSSHNTFLTSLVEEGALGAMMYITLVLWVITSAFRIRLMRRPQDDPELVTLGAALCGALVVVLVAGITADYLLKEVQFWLYAGLVSFFWLMTPDPVHGRRPAEVAPVLPRAVAKT